MQSRISVCGSQLFFLTNIVIYTVFLGTRHDSTNPLAGIPSLHGATVGAGSMMIPV